MGTNEKAPLNIPVPCALKPVEDVRASGVVDLVKWVSIGFLDSHSIAKRQKCKDTAAVNVAGRIDLCSSEMLEGKKTTVCRSCRWI